jgi:hypothetical protein
MPLTHRKWFYPLVYFVLMFISFLLLYTERPYALRVTAFNGLLYGLFNLSHWAAPERIWLGVMHLPLLVMPIAALWLAHKPPQKAG